MSLAKQNKAKALAVELYSIARRLEEISEDLNNEDLQIDCANVSIQIKNNSFFVDQISKRYAGVIIQDSMTESFNEEFPID